MTTSVFFVHQSHGNNVAVVVEQPVIGRIEFAYFVALPEIITGKAMVEILSWSDCLPAGYQNPGFVQKNPVVFEKNAFFRYQTSSVQNGVFHKSLPLLPAGIRSAKPAVQGAPNIRKTKVNVKERSI